MSGIRGDIRCVHPKPVSYWPKTPSVIQRQRTPEPKRSLSLAVRVLGHRGDREPLPHAKLLVLGELKHWHDPWGECSEPRFVPQTVWWGSANWTNWSQKHLEVGFVCDDPTLAQEATDFVADVIAFSEPVGTTCARSRAEPAPHRVRRRRDGRGGARDRRRLRR
jgi:hypothetical protein